MKNCVLCKGEFMGCDIGDGVFHGGEFEGGTFHGGELEGGTFHGGELEGGTFHDGLPFDSTIPVIDPDDSAPIEDQQTDSDGRGNDCQI